MQLISPCNLSLWITRFLAPDSAKKNCAGKNNHTMTRNFFVKIGSWRLTSNLSLSLLLSKYPRKKILIKNFYCSTPKRNASLHFNITLMMASPLTPWKKCTYIVSYICTYKYIIYFSRTHADLIKKNAFTYEHRGKIQGLHLAKLPDHPNDPVKKYRKFLWGQDNARMRPVASLVIR